MRLKRRLTELAAAALVACTVLGGSAVAAPVVSYTTTGSPGDWTLDFSVTNNLNGTNAVYFFGVELPARNIVGSPTDWDPNAWLSWSNFSYGGSAIVYNNNWINGFITFGNNAGQTIDGFKVNVATQDAPTSVHWFAYSSYGSGGGYTGTDHFFTDRNPGFEGLAGQSAPVPVPSALVLLGSGLTGLLAWGRRKQK